MALNTLLKSLGRLVGKWNTEATHPAVPGVVVHGTVDVEWLEGERFLIHRSRVDHHDFPASLAVLGAFGRDRVDDEGAAEAPGDASLAMHYFDARGVFREYKVSVDDAGFRFERLAPGFSQRFTGKFVSGGDTLIGQWQMSRDDVRWDDDLAINYRRAAPSRR